jgi:hypothetical protein
MAQMEIQKARGMEHKERTLFNNLVWHAGVFLLIIT